MVKGWLSLAIVFAHMGWGADQKGTVGGKRRWVDERVGQHRLVPGPDSKVIMKVDLPR